MVDWLSFREAATIIMIRLHTSEMNSGQLLGEATQRKLVRNLHLGNRISVDRASLHAWIDSLLGVAEKPNLTPAKDKPAKDRSFNSVDAPLIERMRPLVQGGMSPSAAALRFVDEATGGGGTVSKQRRLQRGYTKTYGVS